MKTLISKHKFHLSAIGIIFLLFIFSLFIREKEVNAEMSAEQEWVTAHVLLTSQIWDEAGGPSEYNFNPVYTYSGKGNKGIPSLGGVQDENGDMFYVSYPPLAFIFGYYGTKLLGGPDVYSIRALGLILHFFCALFIYLIFKNLSTHKVDRMHFAGIFAAALYLLSAGTLWMHSILFFSDMLVQLFVILCLLTTIKLFQSEKLKNNGLLLSLGVITFLGCYTEWLAVFLALCIGVSFLIAYFIHKKKTFLMAFLIVGISASASVFTTIAQYSSIAGFDQFIEVSTSKYEQRSGYEDETITAAGYNVDNPEAFELLFSNIERNFLTAEIFLVIMAISFIVFLILTKYREKIELLSVRTQVVFTLTIAIMLHYFLFFNFNSLHNFSNLKTGFLMILVSAVLLSYMEDALKRKLKWLLYLGVTILLIVKIPREIRRFHTFCEEAFYVDQFKFSADQVKKYSDKETLVFSNVPLVQPEYMLRAHHNIFGIKDSSEVPFFMNYFEVDKADFYEHNKISLEKRHHFERKDGQISVMSTSVFQRDEH